MATSLRIPVLIFDRPTNRLRAGYLFREVNSFPRVKLEENCELRGTDNVRGQISVRIFDPNGGHCFIILQIFFATRAVLKIEEYLTIRRRARVFYEQIVNEGQPS